MLINKNLCNILRILKDSEKPLNVGDISKTVNISQPLCSQRLKKLKELKLVTNKKVNNMNYYTINSDITMVDNLLDICDELAD